MSATAPSETAAPPLPDAEAIAAFVAAFMKPGQVYEVRIPKPKRGGPCRLFNVNSGYFDKPDDLVRATSRISGADAEAVYITLNPVKPDLIARAVNRLKDDRTLSTTSDDQVPRRHNLLIDIDPVYDSGISATAEERKCALARRNAIIEFLTETMGWPDPRLVSSSGNGGAAIYAIDEPNDPTTTELIQAVLKALAGMFNDETAKVDQSVYNAARITKIPGTVSAKGDHTERRPWRLAKCRIVSEPAAVTRSQLEALAALAEPSVSGPTPNGRASYTVNGAGSRFWQIGDVLRDNGVGVRKKQRAGSTIYALDRCLTSDDHTDGACIIERPDGMLLYRCHHDRCGGKTWHDAKAALRIPQSSAGTGANSKQESAGSDSSTTEHASKKSYSHFSPGSASDFPVSVFPDVIRQYIEQGAESINVPTDMIAMPLIAYAAGAVGNTVAIHAKGSWFERPNIWEAVIGEPGSGKSPANDYARAPIDALQRSAWDEYQVRLEQWDAECAEIKAAKGTKSPFPERPVLAHYYTTDATMEALSTILSTSPGATMTRDEIVGWVKSHDAYKKGGDRQNWLSLWAGSPLKVDRRGSGTIYILQPCVPVAGGIQPEMLTDLGEEADRRDGFIERFLMLWPDAKPQKWTAGDINPETLANVVNIFRRLRVPQPANSSDSVLELTSDARTVFAEWYDQNGGIIAESTGLAAGFYAKYPGQVLRIALVLHCLHHPGDLTKSISAETITDAISVIEHCRKHLVRILPHFSATGSTKEAGLEARIMRILNRAKGEWVARGELQKGLGNSVPAEVLVPLLEAMANQGRIENRTVPTGARPREESRSLIAKNENMRNSSQASFSTSEREEETNDFPF